MSNLDTIRNDCENTMTYPPTLGHLKHLANLGAEQAINGLKQTSGNITILKYCNMDGVIFNPKHYARCAYTERTFQIEEYPNLKIHVNVGEID